MASRVVLVLAFAVLVFACTGQSEVTTAGSPPTTAGSPLTTAGSPLTTAGGPPTTARSDEPEETTVGPGRLVILAGNGDIMITNPDGTDRRAIATSAEERVFYFQPIWSPDSTHIAWGQVKASGAAVGYQDVDEDEPQIVSMVNLPFYLFWASDSRSIGALHDSASGLDLELFDVASGTSTIIDSGVPFYFSWNPTGDRLVTHVGPDRFEMITTDGDRSTAGTTGDDYYAPQWTDDGILHVDGGALVMETPEGGRREVVRVTGFTAFVANPGGTRAAVQSIRTGEAVSLQDVLRDQPERIGLYVEIETIPSNRLVVVDIETGVFEVVSEAPALAFFWSPSGESLLIFAPASSGNALVALVWTAGSGMREYGAFLPSNAVALDLLPFFPQYAQSMRFWSPNSTAFAYPGIVDGTSVIWVQQLDHETPERISDGSWVSWSP